MFGRLLLKLRGGGGGGGIDIHAIWKEVSGQTRVHGGGGGEGASPPPRNWKKDAVRGNFSLFHLCFTKLGGEDRHTLHVCKMEGGGRTGACPWWEGVGARGLAPTLENGKMRLSKEILISFNYILLMKLGGGIGIHAKWKGVGGQARVHGRGEVALLPPP